MPQCRYCNTVPYVTYCASFFNHVECCRKTHERTTQQNSEKKEEKQKVKQAPTPATISIGSIVINNISTINNVTNNVYNITIEKMYVDYPKNEITNGLLDVVRQCDVKQIQSREDYNKAIVHALDANGGEIEKIFNGKDERAKSQALSFMADYSRTLRRRLEAEKGPVVQELIDDVKDYENDLIQEKNQLSC